MTPEPSARTKYNSRRAMAYHPTSFEAFFEAERDRLYGFLALTTGNRNEAEEIAQDAFVAVWERWDRIRTLEDPAGYLHRTAMNLFRKRYRRAQVFQRVSALLPRKAEADTDAGIILSESLAALTPRQRAALVLTEILGYSGAEAAQLLGISAGTVAALKHQGRAALQKSEVADE